MTVYQIKSVLEEKHGEVVVKIVLSDTYGGLFEQGQETRGLNLKRIQRSLGDDNLKINTILELEYYKGAVSSIEIETLNLLTSGAFILVQIDGEAVYVGKISDDYEQEVLSLFNGLDVRSYRFESRPIVQGLFSEITLKEVIDKFTDNDWLELKQVCSFGVGEWDGGEYKPLTLKRWVKDFLGHYVEQVVDVLGTIENLINLNKFLQKFCGKIGEVTAEKFGYVVNVTVETKQLRGWFYPRPLYVDALSFWCKNLKTIEKSNRRIIKISSTDTSDDTSFFVDMGLFNYQFKHYKMEKVWTGDNEARAMEHRKFLLDKILPLTVEQFFHRLGANFGLSCNIVTYDEVNYTIRYLEPATTITDPITIENERKPRIRNKSSKSERKTYMAYFSYIESDEWNEFKLKGFRNYSTDLEPFYNESYIKKEGEQNIPLFWGFFPELLCANDDRLLVFLPNSLLSMKKHGSNQWWQERSNVIFNRMLWIKAEEKAGKYAWRPQYEWLPIVVWQLDEYLGGVNWWDYINDFLKKTKFYLTQAVNDAISYSENKEIDLEVGGFYKFKKNGVYSWKFAEVGGWMNYLNEMWMIKEVEFDFVNWIVRIRGTGGNFT